MEFEDLSGISLGNLEGILEMKRGNGWSVVRWGILVYLFRPTTVGEA